MKKPAAATITRTDQVHALMCELGVSVIDLLLADVIDHNEQPNQTRAGLFRKTKKRIAKKDATFVDPRLEKAADQLIDLLATEVQTAAAA